MAINLSDINRDEVVSVGRLTLYRNALVYGATVYQVSNLTRIWVADESYTIQHATPGWIKNLAIAGAITAIAGLTVHPVVVLLGLVALGVAGWAYNKHQPESRVAKFALGLELSSGRRVFITSADRSFVAGAADRIAYAIAGEQADKKIVMNFDTRTVNIETISHSNLVGGDVTNSLLEVGAAEP